MQITKEWIEKAREAIKELIEYYKGYSPEVIPPNHLSCPFCKYFRKFKRKLEVPMKESCRECPWVVFDDTVCKQANYDCHFATTRLSRLNRWLRILDLLESTLEPEKKSEPIHTKPFEEMWEKLIVSPKMAIKLYGAGIRPPEPESDMEKPYWIIDRETAEKACWCGKKDCLDNKEGKFFFGLVNEFDPPWEEKYVRYRAFTIPELEGLINGYDIEINIDEDGVVTLALFESEGVFRKKTQEFTGDYLPDLYGEAVLWRLKNGGVK